MLKKSTNVLRRGLRYSAYLFARHALPRLDPNGMGTFAEFALRGFGFTTRPSASEIMAQYLRGFVLFGRPCTYGTWFCWGYAPTRIVLTPTNANVSKRMRKLQQAQMFEIRHNQDMEAIVHASYEGRVGWLTPEVADAHLQLQQAGMLATVGMYQDGHLVGGMWGVEIGRVFGIMSMFHRADHAGALALVEVMDNLGPGRRWSMIDCGAPRPHFERFGVTEVPTSEFCSLLLENIQSGKGIQGGQSERDGGYTPSTSQPSTSERSTSEKMQTTTA